MSYVDESATVINSEIGEGTRIFKNAFVRNSSLSGKCLVSDLCRVEDSKFAYFSWLYPNGIMYSTSIGDYSYIQKNGSIWHSSIGKFCSISWNVSIGGGEHDFHKITAHSMLYANMYGFVDEPLYDRFAEPCTIGNDVWIGASAHILRGVIVGDGAVIAAGAVVTKNVEPYSIVAGIPARIIGHRCSDEKIEEMLKIRWWDFPDDLIKENIELFNNDFSETVIDKLKELRTELDEKTRCSSVDYNT